MSQLLCNLYTGLAVSVIPIIFSSSLIVRNFQIYFFLLFKYSSPQFCQAMNRTWSNGTVSHSCVSTTEASWSGENLSSRWGNAFSLHVCRLAVFHIDRCRWSCFRHDRSIFPYKVLSFVSSSCTWCNTIWLAFRHLPSNIYFYLSFDLLALHLHGPFVYATAPGKVFQCSLYLRGCVPWWEQLSYNIFRIMSEWDEKFIFSFIQHVEAIFVKCPRFYYSSLEINRVHS